LAFFNVKIAEIQPDRRVARRYVVDCAARLVMPGGDRDHGFPALGGPGALLQGDMDFRIALRPSV